jgi:hypothetical protein
MPRDTRIVHEECDVDDGDAERQDVNSDGRTDRTVVRDGKRERCRALDLNFDGTLDAWVYLDEGGKVRRRESDYDRDGRVDEIALYKDGILIERQRATSLSGKLDTWQYYADGKVTRAERDSNADDVVDQWWEYTGRSQECPLIHSDVDGDGRPDPGATVDVCGEQHEPLARDGNTRPPGAPALQGGDLPTEVETKQAPGESAAPQNAEPGPEKEPAKAGGKAP